MKSIGVSNDLPDYLKSKYSVSNPNKKSVNSHKAYKTPLRQGVSSETPKHFQVSYVPVLNSSMKNQEICKESDSFRFTSDLKQNMPKSKPRFNYSEIKSQKFDFDTLKFVEGIDVKAGNSARIQRAMAYSDHYSQTLGLGFGLSHGEFIVGLSQPNVPRSDISKLFNLSHYLKLNLTKSRKIRSHRPCESLNVTASFEMPRQVNTPNKTLRKKHGKKRENVSLHELDLFDADFKSKQGLWKSTVIYKDY